jgi:hypothetical protein
MCSFVAKMGAGMDQLYGMPVNAGTGRVMGNPVVLVDHILRIA